MNLTVLKGNLGTDVEFRYSQSGKPIAKFTLAAPHPYYPKDKEKTYWANLVCFDKTAEIASNYLSKGSEILIRGYMTRAKWTKDGVTHYKDEIIVEAIEFCGPAPSNRQGGGRQAPSSPETDPDIPF